MEPPTSAVEPLRVERIGCCLFAEEMARVCDKLLQKRYILLWTAAMQWGVELAALCGMVATM
jgi:hypothetical protein